MKRVLLYLLLSMLAFDVSLAATYTASAGTNNWGVAAFGVNPGVNDDIIIPNGATVIINTNVICHNLTIQNGGTVQFTQILADINLYGNTCILYIAPGGTLASNGTQFIAVMFWGTTNNVFRCDGVCTLSDMNFSGNSLSIAERNATLSVEGTGTIMVDLIQTMASNTRIAVSTGTTLKLATCISFNGKDSVVLENNGTIFANEIGYLPGISCEFHNRSGAVAHVGWAPAFSSVSTIEPIPINPNLSIFADYRDNRINYCGTQPWQSIAIPVNGFFDLELSYMESTGGALPLTAEPKALIGDIQVLNRLILNDGFIDLSAGGSISILNGSPSALTYTAGRICNEWTWDLNDRLKWSIDTFKGAHIVPFMTSAQDSIPLVFDLVSGNAGEVIFSTFGTSPDNQSFPTFPLPVFNLSNASNQDNSAAVVDRFWFIGVADTLTATAHITFNYSPGELPSAPYDDANGLLAQSYEFSEDYWAPALPGQTVAGNSVTVPNVTKFSTFTLANSVSPLPVNLISFLAEEHVDGVRLRWIVNNEINVNSYIVEKSMDGIHYEILETVKSLGNSAQASEYEMIDRTGCDGAVYYRLLKTEQGESELIGNVSFECNYPAIVPVVYPLPSAGEHLSVNYLPANSQFKISILNAEGKLVFEETIRTNDVRETKEIRFPEKFKNGMYTISICSSREKFNFIYIVSSY